MANNINDIIKKTKATTLRRKEVLHNSPIPWIVVIVSALAIAGLALWPKIQDWSEKRTAIENMATEIPQLTDEREELTDEKSNIEALLVEQSADFVKIAEQRLPETIEPDKFAQIIEMYSLLMSINYPGNTLKLNSVSFGKPANVDGTKYASTSVSLNLKIDRPMLKEFIKFLRSSRITDELRNKVVASGGSETASIEFLEANLLPVSLIGSLSMNEERGREGDTGSSKDLIYNTQMQVFFYSKPL